MSKLFADRVVDVACPKCGEKVDKTVAWLEAHPNFTCGCGQIFDAAKLLLVIEDVEKARDELRRKLNRTIKLGH